MGPPASGETSTFRVALSLVRRSARAAIASGLWALANGPPIVPWAAVVENRDSRGGPRVDHAQSPAARCFRRLP